MSRYSMVTDLESYNGFPQINYRPLVMMDGCSKRSEKNVLDIMDHFKCSHKIMYHRKMNGWKWCHHIKDSFHYMHAWNQGYIKIIMISPWYNFYSAKAQEIWKNAWLQLLFYNKTGPINVWVAAVELLTSFEKRNDCKCLVQRNTVT